MSSKLSITDISETGNWNVSKPYVNLKIMKILHEIDDIEVIATFGSIDLMNDINTTEQQKIQNRISALKRLNKMLEMLINNTHFAIKNNNDKELFKEYAQRLTEIRKLLPMIETRYSNERDKSVTIEINSKYFEKILDMLVAIKKEILYPLNRNDLIFAHQEEFDPDKYKARIMDDWINSG